MGTTCTLHPLAELGATESWAILDTGSKWLAGELMALTERWDEPSQARPAVEILSAAGNDIRVQMVTVAELLAIIPEDFPMEEVRAARAYLACLPPDRKVGVEYV